MHRPLATPLWSEMGSKMKEETKEVLSNKRTVCEINSKEDLNNTKMKKKHPWSLPDVIELAIIDVEW